jgi:hypothetical protein
MLFNQGPYRIMLRCRPHLQHGIPTARDIGTPASERYVASGGSLSRSRLVVHVSEFSSRGSESPQMPFPDSVRGQCGLTG